MLSPRARTASRACCTINTSRSPFFFQAEDGIRDGHVTGVQTCALPILKCVQSSASAISGLNFVMLELEDFSEQFAQQRLVIDAEHAQRIARGPPSGGLGLLDRKSVV